MNNMPLLPIFCKPQHIRLLFDYYLSYIRNIPNTAIDSKVRYILSMTDERNIAPGFLQRPILFVE